MSYGLGYGLTNDKTKQKRGKEKEDFFFFFLGWHKSCSRYLYTDGCFSVRL